MGLFRDFGLPELLIILVIVVLLFGPGRIGKIAGELGERNPKFSRWSQRQGRRC